MKKITHVICSIILLLTATVANAQDYIDTKEYAFNKNKTYEKSYSISASDKIKINNKFGFVKFTIWDKNEIKVTAEIKVAGNDEGKVADALDKITISDSNENGVVSFRTTIKGEVSINSNSKKSIKLMETNYTVFLPSNNSLEVINEFGPITIGDYKGAVDITSKFGALNAGNLSNIKNILVEFGKAKIASINNANATFKFSKIEIENIKGDNKLKFEFCNSSKIILSNDATAIDISESYSTLNIKPASNLSANYNIKTSFGKLVNHSNIEFKRIDEEPEYGADMKKEYQGKTGDGACKVKIKSSFGKIILGEATEKEMESKKNKNKEKEADL